MKIITVLGARPQFIKASALSRIFKSNYPTQIEEIIVHTGQHFDFEMSGVFFEELQIPIPKYNLHVSGGTHGVMTGKMLQALDEILLTEKPDLVVVYGDTNSTLAGALAAAKLGIPVAHIEAGLRSFNKSMPEELNRILTDHLAELNFCPTQTALLNLSNDGLSSTAKVSGDLMLDTIVAMRAKRSITPVTQSEKPKVLVTIHRAENVDNPSRFTEIWNAIDSIAENHQVVWPVHPRAANRINELGLQSSRSLGIRSPLSYMELVDELDSSSLVITDSGGLQKEAYFLGVPCITIRPETEWIETLSGGRNVLCEADASTICALLNDMELKRYEPDLKPFGNARAAELIADAIFAALSRI